MGAAAEWPAVIIHTDGGCDPNPGPGGWAAVLTYGEQTNELAGREERTTNNRMELTAAIRGLEALKRPCHVTVYTDSQYLRQGITSWVQGWQRNGWRTRNGRPVENQDLWQALLEQAARHDVTWHWVRGHQGNRLNERADALATRAQAGGSPQPIRAPAAPAARRAGLPAYTLYCRGSCQGNPGPGGYATVVVAADGATQLLSGGWPGATSNAMELWAVIAGLRNLKQVARVTIHSASRYVLDGATRWLAEWEQRDWRTRNGQEVQNAALWQELANVMGDHDITWRHAPAALANEHLRAAAHAAADAARDAAQPHEGKEKS